MCSEVELLNHALFFTKYVHLQNNVKNESLNSKVPTIDIEIKRLSLTILHSKVPSSELFEIFIKYKINFFTNSSGLF